MAVKRRTVFPLLLLALVVFAAFSGVSRNDFVPYDDDRYVTENPAVSAGLSLAGVRWALTSWDAANWHPLTWLSHMADVQLFGLDAGYHHLVSLACHLGGSLVLFLVLARATGRAWLSFFAIALFAAHPLRVESVAWVAERKDVLSFLLAASVLAAWFSWLRRPASRRRYALLVATYVAGLLAKPSLLGLPLALPLLAWWPGGLLPTPQGDAPTAAGLRRAVRGAALLLVPALGAALVGLLAQRAAGGLLDRAAAPLGMRAANAVIAPLAYLGKSLFPLDLAVFYPFPAAIPVAKTLGAAVLLATITGAAWALRHRHPSLAVGWLWYLALLFPSLGLIPVGGQSMADRYTYLPSLGIAVATVWLAADLAGHHRRFRRALVAGGAALVLALVPLARGQVRVWRDGVSLFTHTLSLGDNWLIEHEYGAYLFNARRYAEAETHLRRALQLEPGFVLAHYNLGKLLFRDGRAADAVAEFREVVRLRPDFAEGRARLARALAAAAAAPPRQHPAPRGAAAEARRPPALP